MNEHSEGSRENMKSTYAVWSLLCVLCLAFMFIYMAMKNGNGAETASSQASLSGGTSSRTDAVVQKNSVSQNSNVSEDSHGSQRNTVERRVQVDNTAAEQGVLYIPLPANVSVGQLTVENHYLDKEILIFIENENVSADFYVQNAISGDTSQVISAAVCEQDGRILLRIIMRRVLEFKSTIQNNTLVVAGIMPRELYDYIVVLDPVCGGGATAEKAPPEGETTVSATPENTPSESEQTGSALTEDSPAILEEKLTLEIAKLVVSKSELQNVRIYLTRQDNNGRLTEASGLELLAETEPDFYIRISIARENANPDQYGIKSYYNEGYFIPRLQNVELADMLTREVAIAASNRAVGLEAVGRESFLYDIKIPAAEISVGYYTNGQEKRLLMQENYREKIAGGILNAINEAVLRLDSEET